MKTHDYWICGMLIATCVIFIFNVIMAYNYQRKTAKEEKERINNMHGEIIIPFSDPNASPPPVVVVNAPPPQPQSQSFDVVAAIGAVSGWAIASKKPNATTTDKIAAATAGALLTKKFNS